MKALSHRQEMAMIRDQKRLPVEPRPRRDKRRDKKPWKLTIHLKPASNNFFFKSWFDKPRISWFTSKIGALQHVLSESRFTWYSVDRWEIENVLTGEKTTSFQSGCGDLG